MILFFENPVLFEVRFFKEPKFEADNIFAICYKRTKAEKNVPSSTVVVREGATHNKGVKDFLTIIKQHQMQYHLSL
jgi:hypothetical protein